MWMEIGVAGRRWRVQLDTPIDLAMPLDFEGPQPSLWGLPRAGVEPVCVGAFVGDVRAGGSVNCATVTVTPHGNGTHTESVAHITDIALAPHTLVSPGLCTALLVRVPSVALDVSGEHYDGTSASTDRVVTREQLIVGWARAWDVAACEPMASIDALVVALTPSPHWRTRGEDPNPPYFTVAAMDWLREHVTRHLLVELPSVDRADDGGGTPNHHRFWEVPAGGVHTEAPSQRTITEWLDVPEDASEGLYLLELALPAWLTDAVPSRPQLYRLM